MNTAPGNCTVDMLREPTEKHIGNWQPQVFDAQLEYHGITFYRVHRGFGGKGDREDWLADLPCTSCSVTHYHRTGFARDGDGWGWDGLQTFEEAVDSELGLSYEGHGKRIPELARKLADVTEAHSRLRIALAIDTTTED